MVVTGAPAPLASVIVPSLVIPPVVPPLLPLMPPVVVIPRAAPRPRLRAPQATPFHVCKRKFSLTLRLGDNSTSRKHEVSLTLEERRLSLGRLSGDRERLPPPRPRLPLLDRLRLSSRGISPTTPSKPAQHVHVARYTAQSAHFSNSRWPGPNLVLCLQRRASTRCDDHYLCESAVAANDWLLSLPVAVDSTPDRCPT